MALELLTESERKLIKREVKKILEDEENSEISLKGLSKLVTESTKLNCESGEGYVVMQRVVMKQRSDSRTNTPKKKVLVPMFKK